MCLLGGNAGLEGLLHPRQRGLLDRAIEKQKQAQGFSPRINPDLHGSEMQTTEENTNRRVRRGRRGFLFLNGSMARWLDDPIVNLWWQLLLTKR